MVIAISTQVWHGRGTSEGQQDLLDMFTVHTTEEIQVLL